MTIWGQLERRQIGRREDPRATPTRQRRPLEPPARRPLSRRLVDRLTLLRRFTERALQLGLSGGLPVDTSQRIRLCNLLALVGSAIMAPWVAVEALFGDRTNLPWEVGFLASFLAVLTLNGARRPPRRAAPADLATANACVFAGALLFDRAGGRHAPVLRAGRAAAAAVRSGTSGAAGRPRRRAAGAAVRGLRDRGGGVRGCSIRPRAGARLVLRANAASAFAMAFVVPFFFYRSNLRAEASLERMGQEKLKRVIDSNLIGVVRGRLSGRIEEANDTFLSLLGYRRRDLATGALDLKAIAPPDPPDDGPAPERPARPRRGAELGLRADLPPQGRRRRSRRWSASRSWTTATTRSWASSST